MKKLLILLILLFALPAYAQQCTEETPCPELARLSPAMMGSVPVAAGCATNLLTIGDEEVGAAAETGNDNYTLAFAGYLAVQTCTIDKVEVELNAWSVRNIRAAIYADSSNAPTGDDLGQSAATETTDAGVQTVVLTISPAVSMTQNTRYWIAIWGSHSSNLNFYHNGDVANGSWKQSAEYSAAGDFPTAAGEDWDKQYVVCGRAQ